MVTIICDLFGRQIAPDLYSEIARSGGYWVRILLSFFFLQQSGSLAASPGSNIPYWSLAYEVWYYVFLGLWLFVPGQRRAVMLLLGALIAGPKILLLLPVWLAGVLAHQLSLRQAPRIEVSSLLFVLSTFFLIAILTGYAQRWGYQGDWQAKPPLYFSAGYLVDYIVGLLVAIHIYVVDRLMSHWQCRQIFRPLDCVTRYLADRSFSLYAFHMPLLYLAAVSLPYQKDSLLQVASVLGLVLVAVLALHWLTEKRRRTWQRGTQRSLQFLLALCGSA